LIFFIENTAAIKLFSFVSILFLMILIRRRNRRKHVYKAMCIRDIVILLSQNFENGITKA